MGVWEIWFCFSHQLSRGGPSRTGTDTQQGHPHVFLEGLCHYLRPHVHRPACRNGRGLTFSIYDLAFYLEILLFSSDFSHLISENCVMCCKGAWQSVLLCFTAPAVETALKMEVWGERAFRVCHSLGIQHITQIFTAEILEDLWRSIIKAKG